MCPRPLLLFLCNSRAGFSFTVMRPVFSLSIESGQCLVSLSLGQDLVSLGNSGAAFSLPNASTQKLARAEPYLTTKRSPRPVRSA